MADDGTFLHCQRNEGQRAMHTSTAAPVKSEKDLNGLKRFLNYLHMKKPTEGTP